MAQPTPTTATQKNIVILGGSYGGVSTAHSVLKHTIPLLPEKDSYQIVLISASSKALCRPACPRALISDDMFDQTKLFVDISKQFEQYPKGSFRFVNEKVLEVDHVNRTVSVGSEKIDFYSLVIATGASTPSPLHGLNHDEQFLRESWSAFRKALPAAKSIVIAGGGPTGIETAGELGDYLNSGSKSGSPKVSITVVTSGSDILPSLRPAIAKKAEHYLAALGVTIIKNSRITSVKPENAGTIDVTSKATLGFADGKTLEADLYIPATGSRPNTSFLNQSLLTSDGRVITNSSTFRVDKAGERIYAVGDVSSAAAPAVHQILNSIPVLAANIKRDLFLAVGKDSPIKEDRIFKEDKRETQMVPIGKKKGVGAAMGYALPSFMVWLIKGRDYWLWTTGGLWSGKQWAKEG